MSAYHKIVSHQQHNQHFEVEKILPWSTMKAAQRVSHLGRILSRQQHHGRNNICGNNFSSSLQSHCARISSHHHFQAISVRLQSNVLDRALASRKRAIEREQEKAMVNGGGKQNNDKDEDPIMSVFDEIDLNNDGVISKEEFRIAVEKMRHLDVLKMKRSLASNDISFNHKASVLGRTVLISDEFDAWQFMKGLPDYKHVSHLCPPVALPPRSSNSLEHTLVLDMDETLLHCSVDEPSSTDRDPDHTFEVGFQGSKYLVHSWLRPHLHEFLDKVSENFEVVIFTASQAAYANVILDILDPDNKYFHHRLFRESCIEVDGNLVKDLNVLGRDLSKVMMVDNSPHVFGFQIDNGIPIESWFQDMNMDDELHKLEWFLREIQLEDDVRPRIRDKFQVYQLIENAVAVA